MWVYFYINIVSYKHARAVLCWINVMLWQHVFVNSTLTHYQTTNFILFQTERVWRRQFQIWQKWQKVIQMGRKHCGKRRNWSLRAISPFPTVFSKGLFPGASKGVIVWEWVKQYFVCSKVLSEKAIKLSVMIEIVKTAVVGLVGDFYGHKYVLLTACTHHSLTHSHTMIPFHAPGKQTFWKQSYPNG